MINNYYHCLGAIESGEGSDKRVHAHLNGVATP